MGNQVTPGVTIVVTAFGVVVSVFGLGHIGTNNSTQIDQGGVRVPSLVLHRDAWNDLFSTLANSLLKALSLLFS